MRPALEPSRARAVLLHATVLALLLSFVSGAGPAARVSAAQRPGEASPPLGSGAPFARVYLALRGCTSCSHCRMAIRQMARSGSQGGEARLTRGQVEVTYRTPKPVPLRSVIRGLAENRLHNLNLVDVLFEARGSLSTGQDGATIFTLRNTAQSFPVSLDPSLRRPPDGSPVRLIALVQGWREKGDLRLVAREVRADS